MEKRLFSSNVTAIVAMICVVVFGAVEWYGEAAAWGIDMLDRFSYAGKMLLSLFLFVNFIKRRPLAMQAGICGLMIFMLFSQAEYVFRELFYYDVETYIMTGFAASLCLAAELMTIVLQVILAINHYFLYVMDKLSYLRLCVSQTITIIFFVVQIALAFAVVALPPEAADPVSYIASLISLVAAYALIACAQKALAAGTVQAGDKENPALIKQIRQCIVYTISIIAMVGSLTILTVLAKEYAAPWMWAVTIVLTLLQLVGFAYCLHRDSSKPRSVLLKIITIIMRLSVLAAACLLAFFLMVLSSQYHNEVQATAPGEPASNVVIVQTDALDIVYPQYDVVAFVSEDRPSRSDQSITFCSGATFQRGYNILFSRDEIAACYVEEGALYQGYPVEGLGAFCFYDGTFHFAGSADAAAELQRAAERGGWGFQQYVVIDKGEIVNEPIGKFRCFRVLAELDGELCVIDSREPMYFHDFAQAVQALGVQSAFYLDMGAGWNYSWYRDNAGEAQTLIGISWPFSHNWLVFEQE